MWTRGNLLGAGAWGSVYLATPSSLHQIFGQEPVNVLAVKSSHVSDSESLSSERQMLEELEGCPHILRCYGADFTTENGQSFYNILLEYAAGGSLADRIRSSSPLLEPDQIKRYTCCMLSGLSYMHEHGYVHCDIKPENILLFENNNIVKIGDLGLAMKAEDGKRCKHPRGTPMYMAPESRRGEYRPKTDVWALGCTVLELITGKRPWHCEPMAILYKLGFTDETPEIPGWVPDEAQDFLKKCLVRDPSLRWSAEMLLTHPYVSSTLRDVVTINANTGIKRRSKTMTETAQELKARICIFEKIISSALTKTRLLFQLANEDDA